MAALPARLLGRVVCVGHARGVEFCVVPPQQRLDVDCVGMVVRGVAKVLLLQREPSQAERVIWLHGAEIGAAAGGKDPSNRVV